jgi:Transposase
MEAIDSRVRIVQQSCASNTFPCPHCGTRGNRKDTHTRRVRDIAFGEILIIELTVGEYRARCSCCKTFRSRVGGIEPRAEYTNRVRDTVINRLLEDGMSLHRMQESLHREFLLDLSDGFLYDCLDWKVRQTDLPAYRQWTIDNFSGTLNIDELHLGQRTLLLATDPIGDFPIAFALVGANDQDHMGRFLRNLQKHGFSPQVVVTDGSNLYPKLLAEIWPEARHQLCVFHIIKDINDHVMDALRRLRRQHARKQGRPRRRGRPTKAQKRARAKQTRKEQAHFIWKHRYLIVSRPENLNGLERRWLSQMYRYLPALMDLRQFVLKVYGLFDPDLTRHQARCRRAALATNQTYLADPHLAEAIAILDSNKFDKMIAYLHSPAGQRIRTNNHVERTNRRLRLYEKVRYKWRARRTIIRFLVLALDRWHQRRLVAQPAKTPAKRRILAKPLYKNAA